MKQQIAGLLRRLGLIYVSDMLRYGITAWRMRGRNRRFLKARPGIALPPPYMIYETFRLDYQRYWEKGLSSAQWIASELGAFKKLENCDILDWGCGPGRVLRHLPQVIGNGCRFYGTDYNPAYVDWCSRNIPGITFRQNGLQPPLPFEACSMDAIYGISIFTHLSEARHHAWMAELLRVLRPGGLLLITTHGDVTRARLTEAERHIYDSGRLVERAQVREGHRMYAAYQPPAFMHRLTGNAARVLKHQPGQPQSWGLEQDMWILEKT